MLKYSESDAANLVEKLTVANIESTDEWAYPENVIDFMERVYEFLTNENKDL
jgi:hypothetical protein